MAWHKALEENELREGDQLVAQVEGKVLLFLRYKEDVYAMDNTCPHLGLPLQTGRIIEQGDECSLQCPWHRSAFNIKTGDVAEWSPWPPGVGRVLGSIKREKTLPIYPVKTEEGSIWVDV